MEIHVIPVRINADGSFALNINISADQQSLGFLNFNSESVPEFHAVDSVFAHLPKGLLKSTENVQGVYVARIDEKYYCTVVGDEKAFAAGPVGDNNLWVAQKDLRFGPLPEGVENVTELLPEVYTDRFGTDDVFGAMAAVHASRAMRAGIDPVEQIEADAGFLRLIAQDASLVGRVMDPKREAEMPPLNDKSQIIKSETWENYKKVFTLISSAAAGRVAATLTDKKPEVMARRVAADAAKREAGSDPKPA